MVIMAEHNRATARVAPANIKKILIFYEAGLKIIRYIIYL
jgi:hypothetical protein